MLKYGRSLEFHPEELDVDNINRQSVGLIPPHTKVLEIGCATGFMGKYLKKVKTCEVFGVEIGQEEAKIARKYLDKVIHADIEDPQTARDITTLGRFDIVFSSALIEHLKDPWTALRTWKQFLKKDGSLIITTSNIAHWSMRLQLLQGKFAYQQYGILDNTHLRFFTTETFQQLVLNCGYTIDVFSIDAVGGGLPRISKFLSHVFPNLFAYQMVIKAKPN